MIFSLTFLIILFNFSIITCQIIKHGNVSYQNAVIYDGVNPKNLQLKLISETGDADLYVFNLAKFDKTNINFSDYQFKSDSFGVDVITIDLQYVVPLTIVVLGVSQEDSRYILEISRVINKDLDYETIDDAMQKSPGSSYADLFHQHSFDSDLYYAQDERDRLKLVSMDSYLEELVRHSNAPSVSTKDAPTKQATAKKRKEKPSRTKKQEETEEGSPLYHFLMALLEVIVNVIL